MLSPEVQKTANSHSLLAKGFMGTADVQHSSSEYEIPNAFSRAYYAMFDVCCAWLLGVGVDVEKVERVKGNHGGLHAEISNRNVRAAPELGLGARMGAPTQDASREKLKSARAQFYWLFGSAKNLLSR